MRTANQLYKESGSELPFKEWLNEQSKNGVLRDYSTPQDKRLSADGLGVEVFGMDLKYILLGVALLGIGIYAYKKMKK
jgi:hypothetical protein